MSPKQPSYEMFQVQRRELSALLERAAPAFEKLDMTGEVDTVSRLLGRVSSDSFKVMIIGEFKRGKSTFINALLGREVLPALVTPCTAIINEVKYGETPRAVLHFRDPLPERLPDAMPEVARQHIEEAGGVSVPPLEISGEGEDLLRTIADYVVIPDPAKDQKESVAEMPYSHLELYWPLDLCRNGVEIIDSPGLNEHQTRTEVTKGYLARVDAVVFVMSCQALAGESEMKVVDRDLRDAGYEDIFFICNRFNQIRERERDRVVKYARGKLGGRTALGDGGIFFIDALGAMEGREKGDDALVERSGIVPLEASLARFLVNDRGKIKLLQPARELSIAVQLKAMAETIPGRRRMAEMKQSELEDRVRKVQPRLEDREKHRTQIVTRIRRSADGLADDVRRETRPQLESLAARVIDWAKEYEPENSIGVMKAVKNGGFKEQAEALVKEVSQALAERIEDAQSNWEKETLRPMIQRRLGELGDDINEKVSGFLQGINEIRSDLSGVAVETIETDERKLDGLERVLASVGGWAATGPAGALLGATEGYKGMLKGVGIQLGLAVGLILVGVTNPITLIAAFFAAGSIQAWLKKGSVTEKAKKQVAEGMAKKLREEAETKATEMADAVRGQMRSFEEAVSAGLEKEIQGVRNQYEAALRDKNAGDAEQQRRLGLIAEAEGELRKITTELTDFTFAVAGAKAR